VKNVGGHAMCNVRCVQDWYGTIEAWLVPIRVAVTPALRSV